MIDFLQTEFLDKKYFFFKQAFFYRPKNKTATCLHLKFKVLIFSIKKKQYFDLKRFNSISQIFIS